MGNDPSKAQAKKVTPQVSIRRRDVMAECYFKNVSNSTDGISFERLTELFNEDLAESLWAYFVDEKPRTEVITMEEFTKKSARLLGSSTDVYVQILQPVLHFIKVSSDCAGAEAVHGDEHFINVLSQKMDGENVDQIVQWKRNFAPKFCNDVQALVLSKFTMRPMNKTDFSSDILTPLQMWFLQVCLPQAFFPERDEGVSQHWSPLYTSLQQGISTNRFETLVFDYRGPTVSIIRLTDKRIVAIASDQEWRHSSNRFGGPATCLVELYPDIKKFEGASSIYCNLKLRSAAYGVSFKEIVKIDKDFNQVADIEVWGCSGASTLAEQQKLKNWQKQQAEKHKKVPLPGNWDDNPDKTLLEMAGFQFSSERENMAQEAMRREKGLID